jgi:hypothetical protein
LLTLGLHDDIAGTARARRVRAALLESAHPIAGAGPHDAGAGLIDAERALALVARRRLAPA